RGQGQQRQGQEEGNAEAGSGAHPHSQGRAGNHRRQEGQVTALSLTFAERAAAEMPRPVALPNQPGNRPTALLFRKPRGGACIHASLPPIYRHLFLSRSSLARGTYRSLRMAEPTKEVNAAVPTDAAAEHKPYVPDEVTLPEFTWPSVLVGAVLGILFGAS